VLRSVPSGNYKPPWQHVFSRPRSISGVELDGSRPVQLIYLDESGISDKNPILVVAGVIIHDRQWRSVQRHISELITKHVPTEYRYNFRFHAADLFHGTGGSVFDRRKFPLAEARDILKELLGIPFRFNLPVVYGFARKNLWPLAWPVTVKEERNRRAFFHSSVFGFCTVAAELYLRGNIPDPDELGRITVERNQETEEVLEGMMHLLLGVCDPCILTFWRVAAQIPEGFLPLTKIVEAANSVPKHGAFLLQIADACAFIIRCYLERKEGIEEFISALTGGHPEKLGSAGDDKEHFGGYSAMTF
jgi:Protein of unknown function (DUF3800)